MEEDVEEDGGGLQERAASAKVNNALEVPVNSTFIIL